MNYLCEPIGFGVMVHTLGAITLLNMLLDKCIGNNSVIGKLLSGIPGKKGRYAKVSDPVHEGYRSATDRADKLE
ncbi:MAG: hypothetical protein HN416_07200 [Nitrospina sp.]|jgi:hypothetical protein|nr:hypothetical protein [Nitrospina sp.]